MSAYDGEERRQENSEKSMVKQIIAGIIIVLVGGWITYVTFKGVSLDAMISGINARVAVLESVTSTIKDDIMEIKGMLKEIRDDQKRQR